MFRLALVGGGRMGRTHLRALVGSKSVQVTAIAEAHGPTARGLRVQGFNVFSDVTSMLEAGDFDGALIAVPSDQHLTIVEELAAAGLPILCEKPCGVASSQARAAGEVAADHGVVLQVGYWRRFVPALQSLRNRILAGELGTIHHIDMAQWDECPPPAQFRIRSGGIFIDMGVHEADQIRWLTGQEVTSTSVSAFPALADLAASAEVDSAVALLTLSGGTSSVISLGRFHPDGDFVSLDVFGSRDHVREAILEPASGETEQLKALARQAEAFARHALGGPMEGATAEDAVAALIVAETLSAQVGDGMKDERVP